MSSESQQLKPVIVEPMYDLPYVDDRITVGAHVVMRNMKGAYGEVLVWWRGRHGKVVSRGDGRTRFKDQNGYLVGCPSCDVKKVDEGRLKHS